MNDDGDDNDNDVDDGEMMMRRRIQLENRGIRPCWNCRIQRDERGRGLPARDFPAYCLRLSGFFRLNPFS